MPLQDLAAIKPDLICPRCGKGIGPNSGPCSACGLPIGDIKNKPVLVDFSTSVLSRSRFLDTGAGSVVKRTSKYPLLARLLRLAHGENKAAKKQTRKAVEAARQLNRTPRMLVVGGGAIGSGLDDFYAELGVEIIAFDIYDSPNVQFIADAHNIPLRPQCVDGVVVQAVLEHVVDPHRVVREIERVLRPRGIIYADTPFLQHVHEGPYDFMRFTESGHRYLFRNFSEIDAGASGGPGTQMTWSIEYLFRSLFRSPKIGMLARLAFFWLRWFDSIVPPEYNVDAATGCYFLGTLSDAPMQPKELISRYKGAQ